MSAQPGFFGRIKNNFTQYAAGTDDLSQLSETQQKLLRREALGRLGASLYRNGDFGEAMQQQGEINAKRLEQMQAQAALKRRQEILGGLLNPNQGALVQPGGVGAPQVPTLPNPASTNAAPGQPRQLPAQQPGAAGGGMGGGQAQGPDPRDPNQRAQFQQAIIALEAEGDGEGAARLLNVAKQFAPLETWFAPTEYTDPATGETRLAQFSQLGGQRLTDVRAGEPEAVRTLRARQADPSLNATYLEGRRAGAANTDVTIYGERGLSEASKLDAQTLGGLRTQLADVLAVAPQLAAAEEALMGNDTGALQGAVMEIARYLAPNAEAVSDYNTATALVVDTALQKLKGVGGNDTEKEMERIMRAVPNWRQDQATLRRLFDLSRQGLRDIINDVNSAEEVFYRPGPYQGTLYGWRPTALRRASGWAEQPPAGEPPRGGAGGGSRYSQIPGFELPEGR